MRTLLRSILHASVEFYGDLLVLLQLPGAHHSSHTHVHSHTHRKGDLQNQPPTINVKYNTLSGYKLRRLFFHKSDVNDATPNSLKTMTSYLRCVCTILLLLLTAACLSFSFYAYIFSEIGNWPM